MQLKPFFPPSANQANVQKKAEEEIQKSSKSKTSVATHFESTLKSTKGSGNFLKGKARAEMEQGFGVDLSNVKIHTNSSSTQMNNELGAHAFTNGNDIFFNSRKFNPTSKEGKHLLAHELTHALQQNGPGIKKSNK